MHDVVKSLLLEGMVLFDMSKELNISKKQVRRIIKECGTEWEALLKKNGIVRCSSEYRVIFEKIRSEISDKIDSVILENPDIQRKDLTKMLLGCGYKLKTIQQTLKEKGTSFRNKIREQTNRKGAISRYVELSDSFGLEINEIIDGGGTISDIQRFLGKSECFVLRFLMWYCPEKRTLLQDNYKQVNKAHLCKLSKFVKENNLYKNKEICDDAVGYFTNSVKAGKHLAEIKREMRQRFDLGCDKVQELCVNIGRPQKKSNKGSENPQFGKSPSPWSGIGISGIYMFGENKVFFRSLLELVIFDYLYKNNIEFKIPKIRIPYKTRQTNRTYVPDLIIGNTVYEIKPRKLVNTEQNTEKFEAAKTFCLNYSLKFDVITEHTYQIDYPTIDYITSLINEEKVCFSEKSLGRLLRSYGTWRKYVKSW